MSGKLTCKENPRRKISAKSKNAAICGKANGKFLLVWLLSNDVDFIQYSAS